MKKLYLPLVSLLTILIIAASCHKKSLPDAGKGGTATLVVLPQHHTISKNIDTCEVYIKYNTQNAPANNVYDDSTSCTFADSIVTCTFTGLKNGDYYIYGYGFDSSTAVNQHIHGGLYVPITQQNATTTVLLPISEIL